MRSIKIKAALLGAMIVGLAGAPANAKVEMEAAKPAPVFPNPEMGKRLYQERCEQCHGPDGQGDGPAADYVYPRPRDFTLALYKVRSTPSGRVPTDHDLFRVISEGLPGTSMPAWKKFLSDEERWQLVHHVKTFDIVGAFQDEPAKEQVAIGTVPKMTPELVKRGADLYEAKKCWQCHGKAGRGDGVSAQGMKDDWGHPIRPINFTKSWRFRGGDRLEDIYRTFTTGFNGTPMPSFADTIPEPDDRWALAAFVKSLSSPPRTGQVLKAALHVGEIPADTDAPAWKSAELLDIPLAGQIILEPRWFKPAHDVVSAKALYNDREVALLLEWDDGTHDVGADSRPPDQVAVQFPAEALASLDGEKPYFILGDRKHPVDYWRWNASKGLARIKASGADRQESVDPKGLLAEGSYKDGQYRVIIRRPLAGTANGEPAMTAGDFVPVAFHLWDGGQGEEGLKMAISSWSYLLLQPATPVSTYLWPVLLAVLVLVGEILLARRMRGKTSV